jgi:hypothetical protein
MSLYDESCFPLADRSVWIAFDLVHGAAWDRLGGDALLAGFLDRHSLREDFSLEDGIPFLFPRVLPHFVVNSSPCIVEVERMFDVPILINELGYPRIVRLDSEFLCELLGRDRKGFCALVAVFLTGRVLHFGEREVVIVDRIVDAVVPI